MAELRTKIKIHKYEVAKVCSSAKQKLRQAAVKITLDADRCKGCGLCVDACGKHNIKMSESLNKKGCSYAEIIDEEKCTGCGLCYQICPDLVIQIVK